MRCSFVGQQVDGAGWHGGTVLAEGEREDGAKGSTHGCCSKDPKSHTLCLKGVGICSQQRET